MPGSRQRREAERRRLRRQAQRRRQSAARRRRLNLTVSVVAALLLAALVVTLIVVTTGSSSSHTSAATSATRSSATKSSATKSSAAKTTSAAPTTAAAKTSAATAGDTRCRYIRSGTAARRVALPPTTAGTKGTVAVRLTTSQGPLTFTLNRAAAPCTVNSFLSLARQKYYDGTHCHRLVTKGIFVLQCGDPTGSGNGGPGYTFADELTGREKYSRGVLAMANAGPNTNGSQFFIVDKNTQLGPSYTIFGTVTSGLGVIDTVSAAGTSDGSTDGPPKLPLTFDTVTVG